MKKLQRVTSVLFFMLSMGFSTSVLAVAIGNASDQNVPINTELVQPLGNFSQVEEEEGGTGARSTKAAGETQTAPTETYYEKILKFLGL
jgi:hypothetical protein